MKVTHKFKIPYEKELYSSLRNKQLESGKVWTHVIQYANQYYKTRKKWLSKGDLETYTKNTYDLSSQTVQAIVAKYEQNRKSAKENRKSNKKIQYSWKYKKFFCIPYKQSSLELQNDVIVLKNSDYSSSFSLVSLTNRMNKKKLTKKDKVLFSSVPKQKDYIEIPNLLPSTVDSISYAEIVWKKGSYWFHYSVEVQEQTNTNSFKVAGGDLGEIHSIAVSTEDKALIISGRAIRSIKQWRSKALAELSKKMSHCKKGSRQWKKYNRAKARLKEKSEQQLQYLYHKTTKEVVEFLEKENVTNFVVGNPQGIEKSTKKNAKKKAKTTKKRRQQLSQWSYGEIKQQLKYKSLLKGIEIDFVNEAYTSQDCPFCGGRHKANGRNFKCSVHNTEIHRDVNGSQNIARKKFPMAVKSVEVKFQQPVWYQKYRRELTA